MVTVPLGSLPGGKSGDQRPGFSARLGALPSAALTAAPPPPSPPSMPFKAAFLRVVWTSFSFPGQLPGICCLALGNPLVLCFGFFPGMPALQRRYWRLRDLGPCL